MRFDTRRALACRARAIALTLRHVCAHTPTRADSRSTSPTRARPRKRSIPHLYRPTSEFCNYDSDSVTYVIHPDAGRPTAFWPVDASTTGKPLAASGLVPNGFVRFVVAKRDPGTGLELGVFQAAYGLRDRPDVPDIDRAVLRDTLAWFGKNLAEPARFNRTRSKGYDRRQTRGIAWFRDTATEHISRVQQLRVVLEAHGYHVSMLREERPGYIVYEDEHQVIAEPFADTRTG